MSSSGPTPASDSQRTTRRSRIPPPPQQLGDVDVIEVTDLTATEPAVAARPSRPPPRPKAKRTQKKKASPTEEEGLKRPRWQDDHIFSLLELVAEARAAGDPAFDKGLNQRARHLKIAEKLTLKWPEVMFDQIRVQRKCAALMRVWKTFLAIVNMTGTSYDKETGKISCSTEQWEYYERKFGDTARSLQRYGLPRRNLYEQAFVGTEEVGLTAVEAGDVTGLSEIEFIPVDSGSEGYEGSEAED
ncbi:hypothetical protein EDB81DRAFT_819506, partial [Dactylonectria macrodidyma]